MLLIRYIKGINKRGNTMQTFKKKWQGVFFNESGTTMPRGSMGMSLAHSFHNLMKRVCAKIGAKVLVQKTGHYYVYGYIQRADGQIVYYNYGDFRGMTIDVNASGPMKGVLLRTASSVTDSCGGTNIFSPISDLENCIPRIR
jgi:hypothetical protein